MNGRPVLDAISRRINARSAPRGRRPLAEVAVAGELGEEGRGWNRTDGAHRARPPKVPLRVSGAVDRELDRAALVVAVDEDDRITFARRDRIVVLGRAA